MKRCPDCGFRANDKICPLCGVRMRELPAADRELSTHTHVESGERCVLPRQPERPAQPQYRPQPTLRPEPGPSRQKRSRSAPKLPSKLYPILAVIFILLLRSCMG